MARIVGYIATSLDGFIADPSESLDWLTGSDAELGEHHYDLFIKRIRTVVMGRATYDWLMRNSNSWPYAEQRTIVVTSRPLPNPPAAVETRSDVDALVAELRAFEDGDVWIRTPSVEQRLNWNRTLRAWKSSETFRNVFSTSVPRNRAGSSAIPKTWNGGASANATGRLRMIIPPI